MKNIKFNLLLLYRVFIVVCVVIGLFLQLYPNNWHQLTYYTLISNIIVGVFFSYLIYEMLVHKSESLNNQKLLRNKGSVTMAINLTFLVYAILLAPVAKAEDFYNWKNYLLHYIVPIAVFLDWLFIDKVRYQKKDPILWTIIPLIYTVFALIKGYVFKIPIPDQVHSPYPYFFININKIGWNGFAMYFFGILFFYMLLGYIMYLIKLKSKK